MFYVVTGTDREHAQELLTAALDVLTNHGVDATINTCVVHPDAFVVDAGGNLMDEFPSVTFYFPAFDALREKGNLQEVADELGEALGVPCHTLSAAVLAGGI